MRIQELKERAAAAWALLVGKDGNLVAHAKQELSAIGYYDGDEMNAAMARGLVDLIRLFGTQGHSGFSASFCRGQLDLLLAFKPLGPLTGADDEWFEYMDGKFQNKRCSRVFKDEDGHAYDIEGIVFEEPSGCRYTSRKSRVPVTFPYTPKTVIQKVDPEPAS